MKMTGSEKYWDEFEPIFKLGRVFGVYNYKDRFMIQEMCDEYFYKEMTAVELAQIGKTLIKIAEQNIELSGGYQPIVNGDNNPNPPGDE